MLKILPDTAIIECYLSFIAEEIDLSNWKITKSQD